jgi:hypothetical protein
MLCPGQVMGDNSREGRGFSPVSKIGWTLRLRLTHTELALLVVCLPEAIAWSGS